MTKQEENKQKENKYEMSIISFITTASLWGAVLLSCIHMGGWRLSAATQLEGSSVGIQC